MLSERYGASNGRAHPWASARPVRHAARLAAVGSLALGVLGGGGPAALTLSAASAPDSGRAAATVRVVVRKNLTYIPGPPACAPALACYLDLYKIEGQSVRPLVVLIHGGGWIRREAEGGTGTKNASRIVNPAKDLARNGYVVLAIDYPGATDDVDGTPEEENAVNSAVEWAIAHRVEIDPTKIAFIGGSSGGQLSLLAAFNANQATPGKITMAYSLSGPVDLWEPLRQLQAEEVVPGDEGFEEGIPGFRNIELYLGCDWDGLEGAVRERCTYDQASVVSPLYIGDSTCPLVRITRSVTEDLEEAEALVDGLESRGCGTAEAPRAVASRAGTEHGFAQWPYIRTSVIADLDEHMKPAPPPPPPPPGAS